jgi:hemerythrin-like domain-containing protein
MMPIGPLMIEHRLIERMVKRIGSEVQKIGNQRETDIGFIAEAIDFIRMYADRCHHGKEENILFRDLGSKPLSEDHKKTMEQLVEEHVFARKIVGRLAGAKDRYAEGEKGGAGEILECLRELVGFYPAHIEKEDKHFLVPCMDYFTREEKEVMLQRFMTFGRGLIHEKYRQMVEKFEAP